MEVKLLICLFCLPFIISGKTVQEYDELRQKILDQENENFLGSELVLDTYETIFNDNLMARKRQELATAFSSGNFPPSQTFYNVKDQIEASNVYKRLVNFCQNCLNFPAPLSFQIHRYLEILRPFCYSIYI